MFADTEIVLAVFLWSAQRVNFVVMPVIPRVDRLKTLYAAAKGLNYSWRLKDFLSAPQHNGVTNYIPQLHRVTIRFCKQASNSAGVRNYVERELVKFARENPSVVVYVLPVR